MIKKMPFITLSKENEMYVQPYQALAPFYDHLMSHVDYDGWTKYVLRLAEVHGIPGRQVIDLSCGTGTICQKLGAYNLLCIGCDGSKQMLTEAVRKTKFKINSSFICSDMRHIPLSHKVDLVISLYDSMNYLLFKQDWHRCLSEVYNILNSRGIFIFDISTIENSEKLFKNYHHSEATAIGEYHRKSVYDSAAKMQYNYFKIIFYDNPTIVYCEEHKQRIFYINEIIRIIRDSPFQLKGCYSDFSLQSADEHAERVHFVLKK